MSDFRAVTVFYMLLLSHRSNRFQRIKIPKCIPGNSTSSCSQHINKSTCSYIVKFLLFSNWKEDIIIMSKNFEKKTVKGKHCKHV